MGAGRDGDDLVEVRGVAADELGARAGLLLAVGVDDGVAVGQQLPAPQPFAVSMEGWGGGWTGAALTSVETGRAEAGWVG